MVLRKLVLFAMAMAVLTFSSCIQDRQAGAMPQKDDRSRDEAFALLVSEIWDAKDEHLLPVIDSLVAAGELTSARADFLRGLTYECARHVQVAERYYEELYKDVDPETEGWDFYCEVAGRLSQVRMTMYDQAGAMAVATEMLDRAEKAGKLTDRWRMGFLWSIAACQGQLGMKEADQTTLQVYDMLEELARKDGDRVSENLLAWTYVVFETKLDRGDFAEAEQWLDRADDLLRQFTRPGDSTLVRNYSGELAMARVYLVESQGNGEQAYALFEKSLPVIMLSPESVSEAAGYLLTKEKYTEAADLYDHIDEHTPADNRDSVMNLDNIGLNMIPRLKANLGAGRKGAVAALASRLVENYGQALRDERDNDAAELAVLFDTKGKELQIAEQQARLSKQRLWGAVIGFGLLLLFFVIYTSYRRRADRRLAEMKAARERIESELNIARDIQMSLIPSRFPEVDGLDMYAEMTPAKAVGGDLYDYVMQDGRLYFCVGDVSGKGVPASLFMAQTARLFRTFAAEGMLPADMAFRMNNAVAENNEQCMFVTMFIGLLALDTGRLEYCNCGHNAPVLDGQFLEMPHENQPLGLWENDAFFGDSVEDIRGRQLLVYSDGLNEAENAKQELLGNDRLIGLMADAGRLSSRQVIDRLRAAVEQHRAGAEPNDDLTLLCLRLQKPEKLDNN